MGRLRILRYIRLMKRDPTRRFSDPRTITRSRTLVQAAKRRGRLPYSPYVFGWPNKPHALGRAEKPTMYIPKAPRGTPGTSPTSLGAASYRTDPIFSLLYGRTPPSLHRELQLSIEAIPMRLERGSLLLNQELTIPLLHRNMTYLEPTLEGTNPLMIRQEQRYLDDKYVAIYFTLRFAERSRTITELRTPSNLLM